MRLLRSFYVITHSRIALSHFLRFHSRQLTAYIKYIYVILKAEGECFRMDGIDFADTILYENEVLFSPTYG